MEMNQFLSFLLLKLNKKEIKKERGNKKKYYYRHNHKNQEIKDQ